MRRRSSSPGGQGFPACRSPKFVHRRSFDGSPRRQPSPLCVDGRRRPGGKVFQLVARQNSFTEGVLTAPLAPLFQKLFMHFMAGANTDRLAPRPHHAILQHRPYLRRKKKGNRHRLSSFPMKSQYRLPYYLFRRFVPANGAPAPANDILCRRCRWFA